MINTKLPRRKVIKAAFSVTGIAVLFTYSSWEQVLSAKPNSRNAKIMYNPPPVPNNGSPTGRRKGAGSYGDDCKLDNNAVNKSLVALVPKEQKPEKADPYVWGRMTSKNPTLWFYVPYSSGIYAEFVLHDQDKNEIHRECLKSKFGVIGYNIPPTVTAKLKIDELYKWFLKIKCERKGSPYDFVIGWLQWTSDSSIESQSKTLEPLKRAALYADKGIWYDALNILAQLRYEHPDNPDNFNHWNDLLQQVDLSNLSKEPVVGRYSPTQPPSEEC